MLTSNRNRSVERRHDGPAAHHITPCCAYGWNAGFSAAGGVIKVVRYLKARGVTDITIDLVFKHARAAGAVRHLSNAAKLRWCKSVVRLYEQERAAARAAPAALS